jgi:tetratricopeptide (TPR) repeat protein
MVMLDNIYTRRVLRQEMSRKMAILGLCSSFVFIGISCRNAVTAPTERSSARSSSEAIAEADRYYADRADLVKVRQGIVSLRQAQANDSANYDIAWRLAKFNYYLGAHSDNSTEQDKAFQDGLEAGELAVRLQDAKPEGHFWLGANYGGRAQISTLSGFSELEDIKGQMEAVIKIDERFQSGSAYMVLGQVYLQAPRLLGGDVQKAIEYLEKGIKLGPDNALLHVRLAQAYAAANRDSDAKKMIGEIFAMKPVAAYEPEYNEAVAEARKLQEKLK